MLLSVSLGAQAMERNQLERLESMLAAIQSASGRMGYVTMVTIPEMRKTDNPYYGRVKKVQTVQFRLQSYRSVKSAHDGTPIASTIVQPLKWAEHIAPFVIRHKS